MAAGNVLSHILTQLGRGPAIIMNALEPVRDFLWIEDAVEALCYMVMREAVGLFNVGSGVGTSIRDLVDLAQATASTHQDMTALHTLARPSHLVLDISATTQVLGWQPQIHLEEGVRRLVHMTTEREIQWR
jgi:UDP-glucose 4-epimerase